MKYRSDSRRMLLQRPGLPPFGEGGPLKKWRTRFEGKVCKHYLLTEGPKKSFAQAPYLRVNPTGISLVYDY